MLQNFKLNQNVLSNGNLENESKLFLILSLLHINGIINNDSINALFNSLRLGKLYRYVNTFYFKGTDTWYNDENILEIYTQIFQDKMTPRSKNEILRLNRLNKLRTISGVGIKTYKTELSFDETLKYLNLYLNKNRNFCIDYLFHNFIKPSVVHYNYNKKPLSELFDYDFSNLEINHSYSSYYDDDDYDYYYDDDFDSFRSNRREEEKNKAVRKDISKLIDVFLNAKRTQFNGSYKEFVVD